MTNIDIYAVLASKPHNPIYLSKYISYLKLCATNVKHNLSIEKHHICPKASDMFPELHHEPANIIKLTPKQHFYAHRLLWLSYGGSQSYAFKTMVDGCKSDKHIRYNTVINATLYEKLKCDTSKRLSINTTNQHKLLRENSYRQSIITDIKNLTKHYEIKGIHNWSKRSESYMLNLYEELKTAFKYEFPTEILKARRQVKLYEIRMGNIRQFHKPNPLI